MIKMGLSLAMISVLLALHGCSACSAGSVVVDIIGSDADNVTVESGSDSVDLEIIGSLASDIEIAPPHIDVLNCCCGQCCNPGVQSAAVKPSYPWDSMHLGVDAWYGTFWYTDINMPKWPQI